MIIRDFLLDADYITAEGRERGDEAERERAVLRLFFRNNVVYDDRFKPYFYAAVKNNFPLEKAMEEIKALENIVDVEKVERKFLGDKINVLKIIVSHPKVVPRKRSEIKEFDFISDIFEHDILFARRYLIDNNISPFLISEIDVEERGNGEGKGGKGKYLKNIKQGNEAARELKILAFDIEVYSPKGAPREREDPIIMISIASSSGLRKVLTWREIKGLSYVEFCESEVDMLKRFERIIREEDPDIILGYNTDGFDLPYIKAREKKLKIKLNLGRVEGEIKIRSSRGIKECEIPGREHVDLYPIIRRSIKLSSYVLEDVVYAVLGKEKEKISGEEMPKLWDAGEDERKAFAEYAMEDAVSALELAYKFLPLYIELSQIVGLPLFDVSRMTSGQLVEWLLIRHAHKENELVPNKAGGEEYLRRAEDTYAGAYVVEPKKSLAENIAVFDFRSLYPSIIVTHNIDMSTLRHGKNSNSPPDLSLHFTQDKKGFIPSVVEEILKKRIEAKKAMKKANDSEERKALDLKQHALKLIANSFYGYMGYPRARWYKKECAESVTSFARSYIKKVMEKAEKEFGMEVIYGDTDSLFVVLDKKNEEKIERFLNEVNKSLPGIIELEYEGFYRRGLFLTKKRYALINEKGEITVKGLELVRRDWAEIAKATQKAVLEAILKEGNPEKAAEIVKEQIRRIKNREVSLSEIVLHTQITKSIETYKNVGPHVKAARKAIAKGREVYPGMIIKYVIVKGKGMISDRATPVEDVSIEDYDADYYIENQILPPVARILEALGYALETLKGEKKQADLKSWFS